MIRITSLLSAMGILIALAAGSGCGRTRFRGDARVPNGPSGCEAICAAWGMDMAGMVAVGGYSTACVCEVPGKEVAVTSVAAAVVPAVAGVVMQQRRREALLLALLQQQAMQGQQAR